MDLSALRGVADPIDRARRARQASREVEQIRTDAIGEAARNGMSQAAIGDALGVTRARISQILKGGPGPERAFWGADEGAITVSAGRKLEAGKPAAKAGPAVAVEDIAAFEMLREHVAALDLSVTLEYIEPPGIVNLNRAGLVVICGPRLSPIVGQVLASDRALGFACDGTGWSLKDHQTGRTYRSPMDDGENVDIAYLGRLPRPDGRGTFVYMAGIHAPGEAGAVHYLTTELDQVWQQVRDHRFSTLIRSVHDPENHNRIISSERITDFYRPEGN